MVLAKSMKRYCTVKSRVAWRRRACIAEGGLDHIVLDAGLEEPSRGISCLGKDEIRQFQCTPRKLVARSIAQSRRCKNGSGKPCQTSTYCGWPWCSCFSVVGTSAGPLTPQTLFFRLEDPDLSSQFVPAATEPSDCGEFSVTVPSFSLRFRFSSRWNAVPRSLKTSR